MADNLIHNFGKLGRVISFAALPHIDDCSPSDIDMMIEVGSKKQVLVADFKEFGKDLTNGQRILLERICHAFEAIGYDAVAILAWHDSADHSVDAAQACVARWYWKRGWQSSRCQQPLLEWYSRFFKVTPSSIPDDDAGASAAFGEARLAQ